MSYLIHLISQHVAKPTYKCDNTLDLTITKQITKLFDHNVDERLSDHPALLMYTDIQMPLHPVKYTTHRKLSEDSRIRTQKYLFDHYLHFLKLHIINNYINSPFICSMRLPLRSHVVAGMGATFMETKIHVRAYLTILNT